MELWNEIINTAMLGTAKKMPDKKLLPGDVKALADFIEQQPLSREEQFLQIASLAFNYRQGGVTAIEKKDASTTKAQGEEKPYCSDTAMQVLNDVLENENLSLLQLWLSRCNASAQIVAPATIPAMLSIAVQHKNLRTHIISACGKRGQWLCLFNKEWNFAATGNPAEIWQTGALERRKQVLIEMRNTDVATALQWLQQTWAQEDSNTKTVLLEALSINLSGGDEPFLTTLSSEKSKKVRDAAIALLKNIPSSALVQSYIDVLRQSIAIKKEKTMLGLGSKKVLAVHIAQDIPAEVFASGIDKLSSQKNIRDDIFTLYQLISFVPPSFWEEHLSSTPAEILELFQKSGEGKQLFSAFALAAERFKAGAWAEQIIKDEHALYPDLIPLLTPALQDIYLQKYFEKDTSMAVGCMVKTGNEWSMALTKKMILYAVKNPYQYNKAFFTQTIQLMPVAILPEIERLPPAGEQVQNTWINISAHIIKLLQLKKRIIQSFNV